VPPPAAAAAALRLQPSLAASEASSPRLTKKIFGNLKNIYYLCTLIFNNINLKKYKMNNQVSVKKRDFLKNIKTYVNLVEQGFNVVVHRAGSSFSLSPVEYYVSDEEELFLEKALQDGLDDLQNDRATLVTKEYLKSLNERTTAAAQV
jgi:hypothetical protein